MWHLGNLGIHYTEHLHRCISIGWCCSAKGLVELVSRVLGLKTWPVSSTALQVYLVYEIVMNSYLLDTLMSYDNFRAGEKNQKLWKLCTQSHMDNDLQYTRTLLNLLLTGVTLSFLSCSGLRSLVSCFNWVAIC